MMSARRAARQLIMMLQVHDAVLEHALPPWSTQISVLQHCPPPVHAWPAPRQVDAWQVPLETPVGITQVNPEQQSPVAVHTALCG